MILFKVLSWIFLIFIIILCVKEIKNILQNNKQINEEIKKQEEYRKKRGYWWGRTYSEDDLENPLKPIWKHFWYGITAIILAFFISLVISALTCTFYCPMENYEYDFKINSLKDNLVTAGDVSGGIFCVTGSIDGEINYYYSRTMINGDRIGHIPANKAYVKYNNEVKPKITVYKERTAYPEWFKKWFFAFDIEDLRYYVITVPEGTMINNGTYEVDLE